jgi:hypothetical protein
VSQNLEEWHAFIAAHLREPVEHEERADGATYFTSGNPGEVIVRLSRSSVTVWEYSIAWDGAYQQVVRPRLIGSVRWRRISERAGMKAVQALIEAARESRQAKFRECQHCGERVPPEGMKEDGDVCLSCAQRRSGVVH